jgi:hypothetical protein
MANQPAWTLTPCCPQFEELTFAAIGSLNWINDGYDNNPGATNFVFVFGTCYSVSLTALPLQAPNPPLTTEGQYIAAGSCEEAALEVEACNCEDLPPAPGTEGCGCPEGYIYNEQTGLCESIINSEITTNPLSCCYLIDACDNEEPPFEISLAGTETTELVIGNVYSFSDPGSVLDDLGCFTVVQQIPCDSPVFTDVTVSADHESTDCDVCVPCYELTDCADSTNTLIIKWDSDSPVLVENTAYIFDFAPGTCWTAELQFSPCEGTLYSSTNVVTTYIDCDECIKPCYKLIDCEVEGYPTISTDNVAFEAYVGKVIQWEDQLGETHCATVEKYICKDETWPVEPIIVLDCFDTCEDCLPKPVPETIFELSSRSVRPGYNTPGCPPEYYEKVKCKFSEAVYQEMIARRYGIETCCDIDKRKYEIKHEMLNLDALKDPYLCNPICATYRFNVLINSGDSAEVRYIDCDTAEEIIIPIDGFVGTYSPEICALTTFTPTITITRADSSIEQYKFETDFNVCCTTNPLYFEYEFTSPGSDTSGYPPVTITYRNTVGETVTSIVPGCVFDGKTPCPSVSAIFCAEYGSITIDAGPDVTFATNEDCLDTPTCQQDSRLVRIGDCP